MPLPGRRDAAAPPRLNDPLRRQLRLITLAWVFGAMWMWTIQGAAMTQFARALGMPDWGFGVLAALPFLGTFAQLPAAWSQQRFGWRRGMFILTMSLSRLMWVVAAALPWALPGLRDGWWVGLMVVLAGSWVLNHLAAPLWMNWMSDIIPRRVRGRYFARRNLTVRPVAVVVALAIGYILDTGQRVADHRPDIILQITSCALAIAGLLGTLDILLFRYVDDPDPPEPNPQAKLWDALKGPLADTQFRWYLAFNFTFMFGIGFIGQYVWLYVLDVCQWSNTKANLLIIVVPLAVTMITYKAWGRLCDRLGKKPVLIITGSIITCGSLGWLWIDKTTPWPGYALILAVNCVWPGMEIANFNFILGWSGGRLGKRRTERTGGTGHVAVNSIAIAIGGSLSGVLAGLIAGNLKGWTYALPAVGVVLTYHSVLFLISSVLRACALLFALKLEEPAAAGTRDAIRYVTGSIYGNVRQAVLLPTRVVGRAARYSYRITRLPGERAEE